MRRLSMWLFMLTCCLGGLTAQAGNSGVIDQNQRVDLDIQESFTDTHTHQNFGPYDAQIGCKAYVLDSYWLVVAGTCMRYDNGAIFESGDQAYMKRYGRKVTGLVSSFKENPVKRVFTGLDASHHAENGNIMLIWSHTPAFFGPYVNILATSSPENLFTLSANHTIKINTARGGTNSTPTRTLKSGSIKGRTFELDEGWSDLSGTATDPLFLINPARNEFLSAYNNGYVHYALQMRLDDVTNSSSGGTSPRWYTLSQQDLHFIRDTIQKQRPGDWARIKGRLFFNQTNTPYFK